MEINSPKIAIGIVNYNGAEMTLNCISQLKNDTYSNKDFFVLDNHSSDDSIKLLTQNQNITLIKNDLNQGYAGGANKIIEKILLNKEYKYLLLINNDVQINDPSFIGKLVESVEKDEKVGFVCPKIFNLNGRIQETGASVLNALIFRKRGINLAPEKFPKSPFRPEVYTGTCALMRVDALRKMTPPYEEDYFCYWEDIEICLKLKKLGYVIEVIPSAEIVHLEGQTSKKHYSSRLEYLNIRNYLWTIRKHLNSFYKSIAILLFLFPIFPKKIIWAALFSKNKKESITMIYDATIQGFFTKR